MEDFMPVLPYYAMALRASQPLTGPSLSKARRDLRIELPFSQSAKLWMRLPIGSSRLLTNPLL